MTATDQPSDRNATKAPQQAADARPVEVGAGHEWTDRPAPLAEGRRCQEQVRHGSVVRREDHRFLGHLGPDADVKRGKEPQAAGHPSMHPRKGGGLSRIR